MAKQRKATPAPSMLRPSLKAQSGAPMLPEVTVASRGVLAPFGWETSFAQSFRKAGTNKAAPPSTRLLQASSEHGSISAPALDGNKYTSSFVVILPRLFLGGMKIQVLSVKSFAAKPPNPSQKKSETTMMPNRMCHRSLQSTTIWSSRNRM